LSLLGAIILVVVGRQDDEAAVQRIALSSTLKPAPFLREGGADFGPQLAALEGGQ
jgi:hypothetical protein